MFTIVFFTNIIILKGRQRRAVRTRDRILVILEEHKGRFFSGEELAGILHVTRAAVWKAVIRLREEGYLIDAVPSKGYCLSENVDLLSEQGIWKYLGPDCRMLNLQVIPVVGSTNALMREKAESGSPEGTVLLAGMQTEGRGRLGRHFYSPSNTGIYMSLLLRPSGISARAAVRLTTAAAVAACEAIETVSGRQAQIKWVNDIFLDGKKAAGILTEGTISLESGRMESVILGIGINVYPPEEGFPREIRETACAVFSETVSEGKNRLAAEFLNRIMAYYRSGDSPGYVQSYRQRSLVIGKRITVQGRQALAQDVDEDCRLVVRYEDGTTDRLSAGEISINI